MNINLLCGNKKEVAFLTNDAEAQISDAIKHVSGFVLVTE